MYVEEHLWKVAIIIVMYVGMGKKRILPVVNVLNHLSGRVMQKGMGRTVLANNNNSSGKTTLNTMKRTALDNNSKQREAGSKETSDSDIESWEPIQNSYNANNVL